MYFGNNYTCNYNNYYILVLLCHDDDLIVCAYKYFVLLFHLFLFQVLAAATVIAKHTGTLCNACKLASSRTSNPVAKKEFVQFAKEVAGATAEVVKKIKVCALYNLMCNLARIMFVMQLIIYRLAL